MVRTRFNHNWPKRGFAVLWDTTVLARLIHPQEVISLREFFGMIDSWPDELPAANGDALIVAGMEGCLDVLNSDDAKIWLARDLKEAILSFQDYYEGQAGLIFWTPSGRHLVSMKGATEEYFWKHRDSGTDGLPIGRLLFAGAENELERIMDTDDETADYDGKHYVGLHHPRIS
jgi:hypothetical protein